MTLEDQVRILIGGYFGILEMDEYDLKVYILKEVEMHIRKFLEVNEISNFPDKEEIERIKEIPLKRKLQDSLLVLKNINGPLELNLLIQKRLKQL